MGLLDALGWVGESLGKPGAAVRGLLAGRPDQLMNLVPFSDTMGLTDPSQRTSGRDLLRQWGAIGQDDNWGNFAGGMALEAATDPLTYAGGWLAKQAMGGAGKAASQLGGLRGARSGFSMAHGVDDAGRAAQIVGGSPATKEYAQAASMLMADPATAGIQGGLNFPGMNVAATRAGTGPHVWRHEAVHGLVDQARQGAGQGLPMPIRAVGALKRGTIDEAGNIIPSFRAGVGQVADEALAYGLENRGLMNQLRGAGEFLFSPSLEGRAGYVDAFKRLNPAVGAAYEWAPAALKGSGVAGGLGAGYMGASSLADMLREGGA
jgi:hypothetical protein